MRAHLRGARIYSQRRKDDFPKKVLAINGASFINRESRRMTAEKKHTNQMKNTPAKTAAHEHVALKIAHDYVRQLDLHKEGDPFGTLEGTFKTFALQIAERVRRMASMLRANRINVDLDLVQRMARAEISLELNGPNRSELKAKLAAIRAKQAA
jgi:hypothetical protein